VNGDGEGDGEQMWTSDPVKIHIHVVRCIYCVQEGDTLHYVAKHLHLDTNWLRLWNSNGNDATWDDDAVDVTEAIHDPDAVLEQDNCLNVGPLYRVQNGDTLVTLASRFHTTVKKILEVNPDITEDTADEIFADGPQDLCILPCTDTPNVSSETYTYAY
jgi:hypothetical protein